MLQEKTRPSDLNLHWGMVGIMLCLLISYNIICHVMGAEIQIDIDDEQRIFIRTVFYFVSIILFPLTNLLRHILVKLNQTMPGDNPAKNRYFITVLTSLALIEINSLLGFIMFILGDNYSTLYIFSTLGALGIFLHRPKQEEYKLIIETIRTQNL